VSLFLAVLRIYRRDYQGVSEPQRASATTETAAEAEAEPPVARGSGSGTLSEGF
jgi:hypothetical protein